MGSHFHSMDFIFRLFGSKFEGFNPIEDYDSGKAKYDNYSLMRAVEGFTVYDKDYRATQHPPSPITRIESIIAHATKNNKNWNMAIDGTTPLIEAVRVGNIPAVRAILAAWPDDVNQKSWPSRIELVRWALIQEQVESFRVLLEYKPKDWLFIFLDEINKTLEVEIERDDLDFVIEGEIDMDETEPFDWHARGELPRALSRVNALYEVAREKLIEQPEWTRAQFRMFYQRFGKKNMFQTGHNIRDEPLPKCMPHIFNEIRSIAKGDDTLLNLEKV